MFVKDNRSFNVHIEKVTKSHYSFGSNSSEFSHQKVLWLHNRLPIFGYRNQFKLHTLDLITSQSEHGLFRSLHV